MAGAGYKLFNTGDVLTAQQVNEYLQQQTVMVFANSTARTTALSGVLAEGMMSYLQDTNSVEVYNGSAWVGIASDQIPLTTKGDLLTYSTTDTRLPVGTNGQYLSADSTTSTGLKWVDAPSAGLTQITTGSVPSSDNFTISSIPQTYTHLYLKIKGLTNSTGGVAIRARFNSNSSDNYFNTYGNIGSTGLNGGGGFNFAFIAYSDTISGSTYDNTVAWITIPFYTESNTCKSLNFVGSNQTVGFGWASLDTPINGVTSLYIYNNSAYTFNGGTYTLYGGN